MKNNNAIYQLNPLETVDLTVIPDEDTRRAVEYLMLSETTFGSKGVMTQTDIADHFGISRATLYRWKREWLRSGTMERAMNYVVSIKDHEMRLAGLYVMSQIPRIVENLVRVAAEGKSDHNAIEAYRTLHELIITPMLTQTVPPTQHEQTFLENNQGTSFNPNDV